MEPLLGCCILIGCHIVVVSDDDEDDDDEDDTEALLAELEQIKKERAEENLRKVISLLKISSCSPENS